MRCKSRPERSKLELFAPCPAMELRDAQDLMACTLFSLAKASCADRFPPRHHFHSVFGLREIGRRQTLPGYEFVITRDVNGTELLNFAPHCTDPFGEWTRKRGLASG